MNHADRPTRSNPGPDLSEDLPFTRLGHFEIVSRIGQGGMGDVFRGFDPQLNRDVAIKVLPGEFARQEDFVRRFYAEASAAAQLIHPNITQIFFIGEQDGLHFFAMQFVEGESLADLLAREGSLSVPRTLELAAQIATGLEAAHSVGLIHRDIKPGNVLIDAPAGRALLADFGLVKSGSQQMTATGVVMGTVDYISPEQGRGEDVDARSDLYSTGVVMFQMLAGQLPFRADNATGMIFKHCFEPPPRLDTLGTTVPESLQHILSRLLAKDRNDRYATASDLLADLATVQAGGDIATPVLRPTPRPPGNTAVSSATRIIHAPALPAGPELPADVEPATDPRWWDRLRNRLFGVAEKHAPELVRQLQNTQQQLDGGIREYETRLASLQSTRDDSEAVLQELQTLAQEHRDAAAAATARAEAGTDDDQIRDALRVKIESERTADELDEQIAVQQSELEEMNVGVATAAATIEKLTSQRDLLNARLSAAEARLHVAGGRPAKSRRLTTLAAAGVCLVAVAGVWFFVLRGSSGNESEETTSVASEEDPNKLVAMPPERTSARTSPQSSPVVGGLAGTHSLAVENLVTAIAITPSGGKFSTGDDTGRITEYYLGSKDYSFSHDFDFPAETSPIRALVYSADGRLLASGASGPIVRVWEGRRQIRQFETGGGRMSAVLFSPDGNQLLAGGTGLWLFDVRSERQLLKIPTHQLRTYPSSLDWTEDGNQVLLGAEVRGANSAALISVPLEKELVVFDTGKKQTKGVRLLPGTNRALVASSAALQVFDTQTGEKLSDVETSVGAVAISKDGRIAVTAAATVDEPALTIWDVAAGSPLAEFTRLGRHIEAIAITDDNRIAVTAEKGVLRTWQIPALPQSEYELHSREVDPVSTMVYAPAGVFSAPADSFVAVANGRKLLFWNQRNPRGSMSVTGEGTATAVGFSSDGRYFVHARSQPGGNGIVGLRDTREASRSRLFGEDNRQYRGHEGRVTGCEILTSQSLIITAGEDATVRLWEIDSESERTQLKLDARLTSMALSSDRSRAFVSGSNGKVYVIGLPELTLELEWQIHETPVNRLAVSEKTVVTAGQDGVVRSVDAATGNVLAEMKGHQSAVNAVAVSSDGVFALSGGEDTTVRLWDTRSQKELRLLTGHSSRVTAVVLSSDANSGASGDESGKTIRWDLRDDQFRSP